MSCRRNSRRPSSKRGVALVLTLFAIAVISVLSFTAISLVSLGSISASQEHMAVQMFYAGRAGLAWAQSKIENDGVWQAGWASGGGPPLDQRTMSMTLDGLPTAFAEVSEVDPGSDLASPRWRVKVDVTMGSNRRTVIGFLAMRNELLDYSLVAGDMINMGDPDHPNSYISKGEEFYGRMHTNGYFTFNGFSKFDDLVTSSNVGDPFFDPVAGTYSPTNTAGFNGGPDQFYHTESNGSYNNNGPVGMTPTFQFAGGVAKVTVPNPLGITAVKAGASIVYKDDPNTATDESNVVVVFDAGTKKANVFHQPDPVNNPQNLVPANPPSFVAHPVDANDPIKSITVFAEGNVTVQGDGPYASPTSAYPKGDAGPYTGVVTLGADKDIIVAGSLEANDLVGTDRKSVPPSNHRVALVAKQNVVIMPDNDKNANKNDMNIDGVVMALDGALAMYEDPNVSKANNARTLTIYGTLVQAHGDALGTPGQTGSGKTQGLIKNGFRRVVVQAGTQVPAPGNMPVAGRVYIQGMVDRSALNDTY